MFRRLPTVCFGLERKQQTESYATQVADSHPEVEERGAQATRETKRKLNPFVETCEALATQKTMHPKATCLQSEKREPLSLEQFVALIMSPPGNSRSPYFNKPDIHPITTSSHSESYPSHKSMCNHSPVGVTLRNSANPVECTARPDKSGEDLF